MAGNIPPNKHTSKIDRMATMWLYPRLRELPPEAWESMLAKARETPFMTAEWVGIIGGVSLVTLLLGVEPSVSTVQPPVIVHLLRFVLALPLLAAVVGPLYVRRTRRGLDRELALRAGYTGAAKVLSDHKEA